MPLETFHTLIARNKRNSYLLIFLFLAIFIGIGLLIGMVWGDGQWPFALTVASIAAGVAFCLTLFSYYGGASAVLGI